MPDTTAWITAVRNSHDRLTALLAPLSAQQVEQQSYASEWTIADVASHLGSQAEIFGLFLSAGLTNTAPPGGEAFAPIWDRWNALAPAQQVAESTAANEAFVSTLEQVTDEQQQTFALSMFGMELDLAGLAAMRLGEHAMHAWDVAVALDPSAVVPEDAADLLIDTVAITAARAGKPVPGFARLAIKTTSPDREFLLTLDPEVSLAASTDSDADPLHLPAEAFIRLVYGRLDAEHTPADVTEHRLAPLRDAFPGF